MKTKFIGISLLLIGIACISYGVFLVWQRNSPVDLTITAQASANYEESKINYPVEISINSLNLDLPVLPTHITKGKWDDPKHAVAFWQDSPLPGDLGNSVFYGHNWPTIFGKLTKIKNGSEIVIKFSDSSEKAFTVKNTYTITADQTHILNQTDDTRLTLYTCTGFIDSKRFVVIATPKII
jgi:LPXTG-site transpeptidase (sortase) family protein